MSYSANDRGFVVEDGNIFSEDEGGPFNITESGTGVTSNFNITWSYGTGNYRLCAEGRATRGTTATDTECINVTVESDPSFAELLVESQNPGSGVVISSSQCPGTTGTDDYPCVVEGDIDTDLIAPLTANGNDFSYWTECDASSGTTCSVSVPQGDYKKVTVAYSTPPADCGQENTFVCEDSATLNAGLHEDTESVSDSTNSRTEYYECNNGSWDFYSAEGSCPSGYNSCSSANVTICEESETLSAGTHDTERTILDSTNSRSETYKCNDGSWDFVSGLGECPVVPTTHNLSVTINGSGTVSGSGGFAGFSCSSGTCNASYTEGTNGSLSATAASGWSFDGWSGACSGTGGCNLTMSGNRSVTASFVSTPPPPEEYTLTVNINGSGSVSGSVSCSNATSPCSQNFTDGSLVDLYANPASGYDFTGWSGACSGTGSCELIMDGNKTVTANFSQTPAINNVTLTTDPSPANITEGDSVVFEARVDGRHLSETRYRLDCGNGEEIINITKTEYIYSHTFNCNYDVAGSYTATITVWADGDGLGPVFDTAQVRVKVDIFKFIKRFFIEK